IWATYGVSATRVGWQPQELLEARQRRWPDALLLCSRESFNCNFGRHGSPRKILEGQSPTRFISCLLEWYDRPATNGVVSVGLLENEGLRSARYTDAEGRQSRVSSKKSKSSVS